MAKTAIKFECAGNACQAFGEPDFERIFPESSANWPTKLIEKCQQSDNNECQINKYIDAARWAAFRTEMEERGKEA